MSRQLRVLHFGRYRKHGAHGDAHGQRLHVAVVNRAALGSDFNGATLLAAGTRQIIAVAEELEVGYAAENRGHPKQGQSSKNQETDVDFFLLHGSGGRPALRADFKSLSQLEKSLRRPELTARLGYAVGADVTNRSHFRTVRGRVFADLDGSGLRQAQLVPGNQVNASRIAQRGNC